MTHEAAPFRVPVKYERTPPMAHSIHVVARVERREPESIIRVFVTRERRESEPIIRVFVTKERRESAG